MAQIYGFPSLDSPHVDVHFIFIDGLFDNSVSFLVASNYMFCSFTSYQMKGQNIVSCVW